MTNDYWTSVTTARLTRRRALRATGTGSAGMLLLAACGGSNSKQPLDRSGLLTPPQDTSNQAKRGGTYRSYVASDGLSFEPFLSLAGSSNHPTMVYSRLVNLKPGRMTRTDGSIEGEAAESWEFSPDGLQLTFKLKPNVAFQDIAPVSGRNLDSADVAYTWRRYVELGVNRAVLAQQVTPGAPIVSLSTPDSRTAVFKLAYPMYTLLYSFAPDKAGGVILIPKEAEGGFDIVKKMIGTGPWQLADYQPSISYTYKRHSGYYDKNVPFIDQIAQPIIPEYAAGLAQFTAGRLYAFNVLPEDVVATKQQASQLNMYSTEIVATSNVTQFGWDASQPEKTPFRDERVRQAYSLSWDRDAWLDAFYNVSKFESQGLAVETSWNTGFVADHPFKGWWLDPKSKEFGENARYFQHNPAEAKKLLSAAGYSNGLEVQETYLQTMAADQIKQLQVLDSMASDAGFKMVPNLVNSTAYVQYRDGQGKYTGVSIRAQPAGNSSAGSDPLEALIQAFSVKFGGRNYSGFDANGKGDFSGDPALDDLFTKGRAESDPEKRKAIVHQVQQMVARKQYIVRWPGGASGFALRWPTVRNFNVVKDDLRGEAMSIWLDPSLPPSA